MPNQRELMATVDALDALMTEGDGPLEEECQAALEQHPGALAALGFAHVVAQPRLVSGRETWIPDFIATTDDGRTVVVEIKPPVAAATVVGTDRRRRPSAGLSEAIAQSREYSDVFGEREVRQQMLTEHGLQVHANPTRLLIIGRTHDEDRQDRIAIERDHGHGVQILTWDEVRAAVVAARDRYYGYQDGMVGGSIHLAAVAYGPGALASGGSDAVGYWRAMLTDGFGLRLDVKAPGAPEWTGLGSWPSQAVLTPRVQSRISFELGAERGVTSLAVHVNERPVFILDYFDELRIPLLSVEGFRYGATEWGDPGAPMTWEAGAVFDRTLSPWERRQLFAELLDPDIGPLD